MGYAFRLLEVSVAEGAVADTVDVTATVIQDGLAPFYYDLSLALSCQGYTSNLAGVDDIVSEGSTASITYTAVPATTECLSALEFSLSSSYALDGKPVKFAQGIDGAVIDVSLPLPPTSTTTTVATTTTQGTTTQATTTPAITQAKYICSRNEPIPDTICADGSPAGGDCAMENDNNGCGNGGKRCWWNPSCSASNTPSPVTPAPVGSPTGSCLSRNEGCFVNSECCSGNCKNNGRCS